MAHHPVHHPRYPFRFRLDRHDTVVAVDCDADMSKSQANCLYVRALLAERQPGFAALLRAVEFHAATWTRVCEPCQRNKHSRCEGDCDCAKNGHPQMPRTQRES